MGRGAQLRRRRTAAPVREFFIDERRATGSRSSISTDCGSTPRSRSSTISPSIMLAEITRASARAPAAAARSIVVAENEPQDARLVRPLERRRATGSTRSGTTTSITAPIVALTGTNEAYYTDYRGTPQEFISAAKYGLLFQGQCYTWQKKRRGRPAWICTRRTSSSSSRITIRSPIRLSGQPASLSDQRRPPSAR